jgi:hypothetical protein
MNPAQRVQALKQESAFKAGQEREADDKTLRTKGIVGTKDEREAFKAEKEGIQRERALESMTPEQREQALTQEAAVKESSSAAEKRKEDDKTLRTKSIVGSKDERDAFKEKKAGIQRERALENMTPEQREQALKQESDAKAAEQAQEQAKKNEKLRRTVAIVGDKAEREKFRADKDALRRADILEAASPDQREALLRQEEAFKAAEALKAQQTEAEKASRTVAIVGDKAERAAFGRMAPRGTPTVYQARGLSLSRAALTAELIYLNQEVALLS